MTHRAHIALKVFVLLQLFCIISSYEVPIGDYTTYDSLPTPKGVIDRPSQVHIAFAGGSASSTPDHMTISWQTNVTSPSFVLLGLQPGEYTRRFKGLPASTYFASWDHHVKVGPLEPSTRYYYVCGNDVSGYSAEYSFVSAASPSTTSFKFAVWGDLGTGKEAQAEDTFNFLKQNWNETDFMLHVGDISYANNDFLHDLFGFHYEEVWRRYLNDLEPMASTHPYMVLPGNHEAECHSPACFLNSTKLELLRNFTAYNSRFRMPSNESGGVSNMWYSFNYANAHFICFNSETDFEGAPLHDYGDSKVIPAGHFAPEGAQIDWLKNDLATASSMRESGERPWIFMAGHRPIYKQNGKIVKEQRDAIEDLMNKHGVDIYFTGHEHLYMRTWPVYRGEFEQTYDNPSKVVHLLVGGAGNEEMNVLDRAEKEKGKKDQKKKKSKGKARKLQERTKSYLMDPKRDSFYDGSVIERVDIASRVAQRLQSMLKTVEPHQKERYQQLHDRYARKIRKHEEEKLTSTTADWIVTSEKLKYTTGVVEVKSGSQLTFRIYDSTTGTVLDEFDLSKKRG